MVAEEPIFSIEAERACEAQITSGSRTPFRVLQKSEKGLEFNNLTSGFASF
jgi:hypothetical protein